MDRSTQQLIPMGQTPLTTRPPVGVVGGWRIGVGDSPAGLTLADRSLLAKVLLRAGPDGPTAARLGVARGRAVRDGHGTLVAGMGPGEWLLVCRPGAADELIARWDGPRSGPPDGDELVSAVDLTSARALMRLTGDDAPALLATVCAIDLDDRTTPNGSALRTSVAKVATEIVRDDTHRRSYLLACDASFGRYLYGALIDAGAAFGIAATGFPTEDSR